MSDDDCLQGGGGGELRLPPPRGLADQLPVFPGTPGVQHEVQGYREQGEGDEVPDGGTAGRLRGVTRVRGEGVSHGGSLRDKHSLLRGATPARDSRQRQTPPLSIFTQGVGRTAGLRVEVRGGRDLGTGLLSSWAPRCGEKTKNAPSASATLKLSTGCAVATQG